MSAIAPAFYDILEKKLEQRNLSFDMSYPEGEGEVNQVVPGLFYADNIVPLADSRVGLQKLIKICGEEGVSLGLKFSSDKSRITAHEKYGSFS